MGLVACLLLLCCVEGEVRHTAEIEEYVLLSTNEAEQYIPAQRTPRDEAGALHIQMRLGKAPLCATIRTLSFRARNIHREYSAQFTRGCISVKVVHRCTLIFRLLWRQKRSVLNAFATVAGGDRQVGRIFNE